MGRVGFGLQIVLGCLGWLAPLFQEQPVLLEYRALIDDYVQIESHNNWMDPLLMYKSQSPNQYNMEQAKNIHPHSNKQDLTSLITSIAFPIYQDLMNRTKTYSLTGLHKFFAESVQQLATIDSTDCSTLPMEKGGIVNAVIEKLGMMPMADILELHQRALEVSNKMNQQAELESFFRSQMKEQEKRIIGRKSEVTRGYDPVQLPKNWELVYKPKNGLASTINYNDMETLRDSKDLNGTVINFYLQVIANEFMSAKDRENFHAFNTYFMGILSGDTTSQERLFQNGDQVLVAERINENYKQVRKWTKNVNIFQKRVVVLPINMPHHWITVIVYNLPALLHPGNSHSRPMILYFDSLHRMNKLVVEAVRLYLKLEFLNKYNDCAGSQVVIDQKTLPCYQLLVPRQTNFHDCGLYMLMNVESILLQPHLLIEDLSKPKNQDFLRLFPQSLAYSFRSRITQFLVSLKKCGNDSDRQSLVVKYMQARKELVDGSRLDDYDQIDERKFVHFCSQLSRKPRNTQEEMEWKTCFYLKTDINYYELQ